MHYTAVGNRSRTAPTPGVRSSTHYRCGVQMWSGVGDGKAAYSVMEPHVASVRRGFLGSCVPFLLHAKSRDIVR